MAILLLGFFPMSLGGSRGMFGWVWALAGLEDLSMVGWPCHLWVLPRSNILFPVGTMIGERLLYIPSAGMVITASFA